MIFPAARAASVVVMTLFGGAGQRRRRIARLPWGWDGHRHRGGGAAAGSSTPPCSGCRRSTAPTASARSTSPSVDVAGGKITGVALSDDWGQSVNGVVGDGGATGAHRAAELRPHLHPP